MRFDVLFIFQGMFSEHPYFFVTYQVFMFFIYFLGDSINKQIFLIRGIANLSMEASREHGLGIIQIVSVRHL